MDLAEAVRAADARLRVLSRLGVGVTGPELRERLAEHAAQQPERRAKLTAVRREADGLLPELLDRYLNGSDADRESLRDLLRQCPSFRWGVGWGLTQHITSVAEARDALAVWSLKDAGRDWRDAILALDRLCAALRRAGLPVAALLAEAAAWSSDVPRFARTRSSRTLLLDYAQRFASEAASN